MNQSTAVGVTQTKLFSHTYKQTKYTVGYFSQFSVIVNQYHV